MMRILIAALVFFLYGCGSKEMPGDVLKLDKMQVVMWDVIKADAYVTDYVKRDSTRNDTAESVAMQKEIFVIHNITKETYYRSYDYYKKNPELMKTLMDTMSARANRLRNRSSTIVQPVKEK
jgi:Domain of unknown function (DUF4296)